MRDELKELVDRIWALSMKRLGVDAGSAHTIGVLQEFLRDLIEYGDYGPDVFGSMKEFAKDLEEKCKKESCI